MFDDNMTIIVDDLLLVIIICKLCVCVCVCIKFTCYDSS
jgi:hypothetical protein